MNAYTETFFSDREAGSLSSARRIVPIVDALLAPRSVVDVGCGIGTWLAAFRERGIEDIAGIDGSYVPMSALRIPADAFRAHDLSRPLEIGRTFDLALCLEVAEHLPTDRAPSLVASLCELAPAILFSAAIPFQGGTHHVNEQWPEYWAALFEARGFAAIDCVRGLVWDDPSVDWWYAQNTILYVRAERIAQSAALQHAFERTRRSQLSLVHPRRWTALNEWVNATRDLPETVSDLQRVIPRGSKFILVDDAVLGPEVLPSCEAVPFLEHEGRFWGPPRDSATAIRELERLRREGAGFIAFARVAFWWLDCFSDFARYLDDRCARVLANDRVVIFSLAAPGTR